MEQESNMTIEEHFEQMELLLERLESKDISLEESFQCYEAGMEHLRACSSLIDEVEHKVQMLNEDGELEDFNEV